MVWTREQIKCGGRPCWEARSPPPGSQGGALAGATQVALGGGDRLSLVACPERPPAAAWPGHGPRTVQCLRSWIWLSAGPRPRRLRPTRLVPVGSPPCPGSPACRPCEGGSLGLAQRLSAGGGGHSGPRWRWKRGESPVALSPWGDRGGTGGEAESCQSPASGVGTGPREALCGPRLQGHWLSWGSIPPALGAAVSGVSPWVTQWGGVHVRPDLGWGAPTWTGAAQWVPGAGARPGPIVGQTVGLAALCRSPPVARPHRCVSLTPPPHCGCPARGTPGSGSLPRDAAARSLPSARRPADSGLSLGAEAVGSRHGSSRNSFAPATPGHCGDVCRFIKHPVSFSFASNYLQLTGKAGFPSTRGFQYNQQPARSAGVFSRPANHVPRTGWW